MGDYEFDLIADRQLKGLDFNIVGVEVVGALQETAGNGPF